MWRARRGGTEHPWASASVLVPLIIGILSIGLFIFVELKVALRESLPSAVSFSRDL